MTIPLHPPATAASRTRSSSGSASKAPEVKDRLLMADRAEVVEEVVDVRGIQSGRLTMFVQHFFVFETQGNGEDDVESAQSNLLEQSKRSSAA